MADHYLLYTGATSPTGQTLGQWLKDHGLDIAWGRDAGQERYQSLIRWGSVGRLALRPHRIINRGDSIQRSSEKDQAILDMAAAGIRVPRLWKRAQLADIHPPVLGRHVNHTGGTDIVLCMQHRDAVAAVNAGCEYFVEYIPTRAEYRVHVFRDRIIKVSEKILTHPEEYKPWVRNLSTGFTFRQPTGPIPATARYSAIQAVEAFNLDFGAADVIVGDDRQSYVLEVNTAPGLTVDSSLEAYGRRLLEELA